MAMGVFHPYLLRVPEDAYQILREEAVAKSISVNTLFIKMVEEHLRTHRKELVKLIDKETSETYSAVLDKLAALSRDHGGHGLGVPARPLALTVMGRLCERPGCSDVAAMAYGFDADRLLVWLAPREPDGDPLRSGSLCKRHADAMVVPLGWTLDDRRDPTPRLFRTGTTGATAPASTRSRTSGGTEPPPEQLALGGFADAAAAASQTVAAVTGEPLADDDPDATVAIPWLPTFDADDDLGGVLAANSPLLARAFRGTERPR